MLTQEFVDTVEYREDKGTMDVHYDLQVKGLLLRVYKGGTKSYIVTFRKQDGTQRLITLAQTDKITLEQARKQATDFLEKARHERIVYLESRPKVIQKKTVIKGEGPIKKKVKVSHDITPEQALWGAVLALAMQDIIKPNKISHQDSVEIFYNSNWFDVVCENAGKSPSYMRGMFDKLFKGEYDKSRVSYYTHIC